MFTDTDVDQAHEGLTELREKTNLAPLDFARMLLNEVELIARQEAEKHAAAGRRLHEPDFVRTAETVAGIVDHTEPTRQCR